MSSMQNIFPFNNPLLKRILNWKQGDEDETWRNKAVESLIKKLKRQGGDQHVQLQTALSKKSEDTPCVTLSRSQDGRLQVSHKKMLPHVMYCRIFRWPDLQSQHELRSLPSCQYPFSRREANKICINPYHYARVDHSIYPPVVTPRGLNNSEFANASPPPLSPGSNYSGYNNQQGGSPPYFPNQQNGLLFHAHGGGNLHHPSSTGAPYAHSQYNHENNGTAPLSDHHFANYLGSPQQQQQMISQNNGYHNIQSPVSDSSCYSAFGNGNVGPNGEHIILADSPRGQNHFTDGQSPPPGYVNREQHHQQQLALMPMEINDSASQISGTTMNGSEESPDMWCKISYAELNQKIGEPFKGCSKQIIVDGFTNPSIHNRRFSLGTLSNINRNSTIEMTRRAIGKGICLENDASQIFVKNLSGASIFFHSKNCNVENQLNQHAVVKIEPEGRQKIFDMKVFENLVEEAMRQQDKSLYNRVYSLTEHCMIKLSFVKGWGSIYQRQDVTSTPCWIEIQLTTPLKLIDTYLERIGSPSTKITSTS